LNEATGKLAPGVAIGSAVQYTTDHKGLLNSALRLSGSSFVKLFNVPQPTASSISLWIKTSDLNQNLEIISSNSQGLSVFQNPNKYVGAVTLVSNGFSVSTTMYKDVFNLNWHHVVITYDGTTFKFYFDGGLSGSSNLPGTISAALTNYIVGNGYWKGAVDDLRFYSRILSSDDVQSLYNM
jgi:hypothetical protein